MWILSSIPFKFCCNFVDKTIYRWSAYENIYGLSCFYILLFLNFYHRFRMLQYISLLLYSIDFINRECNYICTNKTDQSASIQYKTKKEIQNTWMYRNINDMRIVLLFPNIFRVYDLDIIIRAD